MSSSGEESEKKMPTVSNEELRARKNKKRNSRAIERDKKTSMKKKRKIVTTSLGKNIVTS